VSEAIGAGEAECAGRVPATMPRCAAQTVLTESPPERRKTHQIEFTRQPATYARCAEMSG